VASASTTVPPPDGTLDWVCRIGIFKAIDLKPISDIFKAEGIDSLAELQELLSVGWQVESSSAFGAVTRLGQDPHAVNRQWRCLVGCRDAS
jgi:hypothetical protein